MSTPQLMSAAQDKAFKREAMRTPDASRNPEVSRWLDSYVPPKKILQAKAEPPKQRYYDRRRAELVEQKARVKALLEHRARALKATAHHWPRYRDMATRNENARITKEVQRRERMRLAAEAEEVREARRAADSRVAHLLALRGAVPHHLAVLMRMRGIPGPK
ncbi:hypothetical protein DFH09DRAFT_1332375 [Mycena vulgaris]|nr:hypothetical protein DFH09DRAFT_1332375 [Mycena vulgaris]